MFFPFRTDVPLRSIPWMNWLLIFLNVIIFAFQRAIDPRVLANCYLSPVHPHLFAFFTYAFLHANLGHIFGNMLFLYIFGNNVNDKLGNLGYLAFYLAGAVFAGVGYCLIHTAHPAPVLGASGAIAAVTGAYLVLFPMSNITIVYWLLIFGSFEVSSLFFVIFFFAQDLFFSFEGNTAVAHTAHISGSIFGFTVCLLLLLAGLLPRDKFDILSLFAKWKRKRQFHSLVAAGYNPWEKPPPEPPSALQSVSASPPNPATQQLLNLRGEISEAVAHHNLPHAAQLYLQLKQLDRNQVLSRQAQLDVANQLTSQHQYPEAADAYEQFLRCFPNYDQIEQVQLMLGIVYARYLNNYPRAAELLNQALQRLHTERDIAMARGELLRIAPMIEQRTTQ